MQPKFTYLFIFQCFVFLFPLLTQAQLNFDADEKSEIEAVLGVQFTGDAAQDALLYDQAKLNLFTNDKQAFESFFGKASRIGAFVMIPGFTITGNSNVDRVNYKQAKLNLYNSNQALYGEYFPVKDPGVVHMTQAEYDNLPAQKRAVVDAKGLSIVDGQ